MELPPRFVLGLITSCANVFPSDKPPNASTVMDRKFAHMGIRHVHPAAPHDKYRLAHGQGTVSDGVSLYVMLESSRQE